MPGDSLVIRGQIDGPLDAAHQQALESAWAPVSFLNLFNGSTCLRGGVEVSLISTGMSCVPICRMRSTSNPSWERQK